MKRQLLQRVFGGRWQFFSVPLPFLSAVVHYSHSIYRDSTTLVGQSGSIGWNFWLGEIRNLDIKEVIWVN